MKDGNLGSSLHDLNGIWVVGFPYAQLVIGKGRVTCCRSHVDIAVPWADIPVGLVESGSMCQHLYCFDLGQSLGITREAEFDGDAILARDDTRPTIGGIGAEC